MSNCRDGNRGWIAPLALAASAVLLADIAQAQSATYPDIGRTATAKELEAWDIDVRPDFKGLPKGAGSVAKGMQVWEAKCASCHGVFGESNEFFAPVVGGTTADDIKTGRVARLTDSGFPGRTTLMKMSSLSTLWDYINRAMPWNAPKTLSTEEVYAVTAYILNLGGVVPDDFTLSDRNMADVQKRLPNRKGTTTEHGLWPGAAFAKAGPDVLARACMTRCAGEAKVASFLPEHARNSHGNLADQNRSIGAQRGADTSVSAGVAAQVRPAAATVAALTRQHTCTACHGVDTKMVGPSFREISSKYAGRSDAAAYLANKVKSGGAGVWGATPMPPQALDEADAKAIAQWLADGAKP